MPNWCQNTLLIYGDKDALKEFIHHSHGEYQPLSFDKLVPMPPELREGDGWYDWSVSHWGTKWDVDGPGSMGPRVTFSAFPGMLSMSFCTAWGPPTPAIASASAAHPDLSFEIVFSEPGMGFAGEIIFEKGRTVTDHGYDSTQPEGIIIDEGGRPGLREATGPSALCLTDENPVISAREALLKTEKKEARDISAPTIPSAESDATDATADRADLVDSCCKKIEESHAVAERAYVEVLESAQKLGFPVELWRKSGVLDGPSSLMALRPKKLLETSWDGPAGTTAKLVKPSPPKRKDRQMPPPSVVLTEPLNSRVIKSAGKITRTHWGAEIHSPTGWVIGFSMLKTGRAYVYTGKDGEWQNPPDKSPACKEFSPSLTPGKALLTAEADCSSGKTWDQSKTSPAFREFDDAGNLKKSASFSMGKLARAKDPDFVPPHPPKPAKSHRSAKTI